MQPWQQFCCISGLQIGRKQNNQAAWQLKEKLPALVYMYVVCDPAPIGINGLDQFFLLNRVVVVVAAYQDVGLIDNHDQA
jgi:hypothetical protein